MKKPLKKKEVKKGREVFVQILFDHIYVHIPKHIDGVVVIRDQKEVFRISLPAPTRK